MAIYLISQKDSFKVEREGGYLWSPQHSKRKKKDGTYAECPYDIMQEVKKDDYTINVRDSKIIAISKVLKDCYKAEKPDNEVYSGYQGDQIHGYKIEVQYYDLDPIIGKEETKVIKNWLSKNYEQDSCIWQKSGSFPQQYISRVSKKHANYILNAIRATQKDEKVISILDAAIKKNEESNSEHSEKVDDSEKVYSRIYGNGLVKDKKDCGDYTNVYVDFIACEGNKSYIFQIQNVQDKDNNE